MYVVKSPVISLTNFLNFTFSQRNNLCNTVNFCVDSIAFHGDVKVSTGILKSEERAAAGTALTISTLNLNANDNLAYAA